MRIHALEASGGLTYSQMGRFATADGKPAGTNDPAAGAQGTGRPARLQPGPQHLGHGDGARDGPERELHGREDRALRDRGRDRPAALGIRLRHPRDRRRPAQSGAARSASPSARNRSRRRRRSRSRKPTAPTVPYRPAARKGGRWRWRGQSHSRGSYRKPRDAGLSVERAPVCLAADVGGRVVAADRDATALPALEEVAETARHLLVEGPLRRGGVVVAVEQRDREDVSADPRAARRVLRIPRETRSAAESPPRPPPSSVRPRRRSLPRTALREQSSSTSFER